MASAQSIKKVDILINGRSYTINCPESEEPALRQAILTSLCKMYAGKRLSYHKKNYWYYAR